MTEPWKPTPEQLELARDKQVPDLVGPDLAVLFCGINPGLYSGAVGRHFARPGNRFWPALHGSGFTARRLSPFDERELLGSRLGVTNFVERTTATAAELSPEEIEAGGRRLKAKVRRLRPRWLAPLGVTAYRRAFGPPNAAVGLQAEVIGTTRIWLLPNPSGLNAHYQLPALIDEFARLRDEVRRGDPGP
nr:G/U mismatch-specific DNA glycosylase [Actinomycetota bacterium]